MAPECAESLVIVDVCRTESGYHGSARISTCTEERSKGQDQYKPGVKLGADIDTDDTYLNFLAVTM